MIEIKIDRTYVQSLCLYVVRLYMLPFLCTTNIISASHGIHFKIIILEQLNLVFFKKD